MWPLPFPPLYAHRLRVGPEFLFVPHSNCMGQVGRWTSYLHYPEQLPAGALGLAVRDPTLPPPCLLGCGGPTVV